MAKGVYVHSREQMEKAWAGTRGKPSVRKGTGLYANCLHCNLIVKSFPSRPRKFCSYSCQQKERWAHYQSKGWIDNGYVRHKKGREHRTIIEALLGRKLLSTEVVHHLNENKSDNRPSNLQVMQRSEHIRMHNLERGTKYFGRNAHLEGLL